MNRRAFCFLYAGAILAAGATEPAMRPLIVDFPKASLSGTPVPPQLPNLERENTPAKPVLVPDGAVNLAKGKNVTSSDTAPVIGELRLKTDGDKESDEGCFVEIEKGLQWIQIDLGTKADVHAIAVWHFHSQKRAYLDVVIQISDDPEFKTGVTTVFNNDHDNTSKLGVGKDPAYVETNLGRVIPVKKVSGRHIRLCSSGNTSNPFNHYVEVEVYGIPEK